MNEIYDHLYVFLDRVHIGCASAGFKYAIKAPVGRFPVTIQRNSNGEIGRATIIFDPPMAEESFREELFEPLQDIAIDSDAVLIAGDAARILWERNPKRFDGTSRTLDPTGANLVQIPVAGDGALAEVAWWYGGDSSAYHDGICALDIIWDPEMDPVSTDSPVRNMGALIQQFFDEHGPPSLRSDAEKEDE